MPKFRKKPVEIEAIQHNCSPAVEHQVIEWGEAAGRPVTIEHDGDDGTLIKIETLEGVMTARRDDWIIKGVQGEIYPCKPDIFEATYEPVTD